ncbi:MAG: hypothetical protein IJY23_06480 [Clostridia bacterium]|nr:hypothetical protein [Clostridia bacterium]
MSKACAYVNIALHILLILPLLRYEFSIEEATLVYMISLFFYTLFAYVASKLEKNGKLSARDGDIKKLGESEDAV